MAQHITSIRTYLIIFFALLVLTALTVWVAFIDFGVWSDFIALGIALFKASLVVLFFMHVRYSRPMTKITVVSSLFWLLILFSFTLSDYLMRGFLHQTQGF
jgi:cytochrome c oxidase subunit 4